MTQTIPEQIKWKLIDQFPVYPFRKITAEELRHAAEFGYRLAISSQGAEEKAAPEVPAATAEGEYTDADLADVLDFAAVNYKPVVDANNDVAWFEFEDDGISSEDVVEHWKEAEGKASTPVQEVPAGDSIVYQPTPVSDFPETEDRYFVKDKEGFEFAARYRDGWWETFDFTSFKHQKTNDVAHWLKPISIQEINIGFAEWLYANRWYEFQNGHWYQTLEHPTSMSDKTYDKYHVKTTADLFTEYLTHKQS